MKHSIFVQNENGALVEMRESGFESEEIFQELLEKYPLARQLAVAPSVEEEDVFLLSPRVPEQLEKKRRIMLRELQTLYKLYTRFN